MNMNAADESDDPLTATSRDLARKIAFDLVMENVFPTGEMVRKLIIKETKGKMNPSATTIQSEIKAWQADSFWPVYHAFGSLPVDSAVPLEVRRIYQEAFQTMAVKLLDVAHGGWQSERAQFQLQLDEADASLVAARRQASEFELKSAENLNLFQAESEAHMRARQLNAELLGQIATLNRDIQAASARQAAHECELAEMRESERTRTNGIIEAHRIDRQRIVVELDTANQKVKRLDGELAKVTSESHAWRERATKAEIELAAARTDAQRHQVALQAEVDRLATALRESQSAIAATAGAAAIVRRAPVVARDRLTRPVRHSLRKTTTK